MIFGQFSFGYENINSAKTETRDAFGVTRGRYQYVDANGILQTVNYTADDVNGFRVAGTNIPTGPAALAAGPAPVLETPEVAAARAEHLAAHVEAQKAATAEKKKKKRSPEDEDEPTPEPESEPEPEAERKKREAEPVLASPPLLPSAPIGVFQASNAPLFAPPQPFLGAPQPFFGPEPLRFAPEHIPFAPQGLIAEPFAPEPFPFAPEPLRFAPEPIPFAPESLAFAPEPLRFAPEFVGPAPLPAPLLAPSSQFHAQDELGQFSFGYENINSAKTETRDAFGVTRGRYQYVDANGLVQMVEYVSDDVNGFRVVGTNLPVAPSAGPVAPAALNVATPAPVVDSPEVAKAKEEHFAAHAEANAALDAANAKAAVEDKAETTTEDEL